MNAEHLRQKFKELVDISEEDLNFFLSKISMKTFSKRQIILEFGQVEDHISFLEKGIVRFYIPRPDHDLTFGFCFQNSFFSAYDSFINQEPSAYKIEAVTEVSVWQVSREDLHLIYTKTDKGEQIGRKIAENLYAKKMRRELSLLQNSATQRYLDLFTEQPQLLQNIPLKYLASYIGVRPQSLSRIRRKIT